MSPKRTRKKPRLDPPTEPVKTAEAPVREARSIAFRDNVRDLLRRVAKKAPRARPSDPAGSRVVSKETDRLRRAVWAEFYGINGLVSRVPPGELRCFFTERWTVELAHMVPHAEKRYHRMVSRS